MTDKRGNIIVQDMAKDKPSRKPTIDESTWVDVHLRLPTTLVERLKTRANQERRSLTNLLSVMVEELLMKQEEETKC